MEGPCSIQTEAATTTNIADGSVRTSPVTTNQIENELINHSNNITEPREICRFYSEGRCRFGQDCINLHEGEVRDTDTKKKVRKVREEEKKATTKKGSGKKPAMKTARDVIKRIMWDSDLPQEYFLIGYLDRFLGIVEDSFSSFNWGDLASLDWDTLAIPQHRIYYFKYKTEKVWDKETRLDLVFGSTGCSERTILQTMDEVDARLQLQRLTCADGSEDQEETDDSDEEDAIAFRNQNLNDRLTRISEEYRSTHFLAVQVTNKDLVRELVGVQRRIVEQEPILHECCMKEGLFHITLGMLRIDDIQGIQAAVDMVDQLKDDAAALIHGRDKSLEIKNLSQFGHRVVYAEVHPADPQLFQDMVQLINTRFAAIKDKVKSTNDFEFIPHLTLLKVSRPIARLRKSKYIDQSHYSASAAQHFGSQGLDNLQLCIIESSTRRDGFYTTLTDIKFQN